MWHSWTCGLGRAGRGGDAASGSVDAVATATHTQVSLIHVLVQHTGRVWLCVVQAGMLTQPPEAAPAADGSGSSCRSSTHLVRAWGMSCCGEWKCECGWLQSGAEQALAELGLVLGCKVVETQGGLPAVVDYPVTAAMPHQATHALRLCTPCDNNTNNRVLHSAS